MKLYQFKFVDGGQLHYKDTNDDEAIQTTPIALANSLTDYLHYIFSNQHFLIFDYLYLSAKHDEFGDIINYDKKAKTIYIKNLYKCAEEHAKEYEYGLYSESFNKFLGLLHQNDTYTIQEITEVIEYSIKKYMSSDIDTYGGYGELIVQDLHICENIE